jgi:hypothetical protein
MACQCFHFTDSLPNHAPGDLAQKHGLVINSVDFECLPSDAEKQNRKTTKIKAPKGFKWSRDMKPHMNTEYCEKTHWGVVLKGEVTATHKNGNTITFRTGDTYLIAPEHDYEVLEDCELCEFDYEVNLTPPVIHSELSEPRD